MTLFQNHFYLLLILTSIVSVIAGIVINIIAKELPIRLQKKWRKDCCELLNFPCEELSPPKLRSRTNPWRFGSILFLSLVLGITITVHYGNSLQTPAALILVWGLLLLSSIDLEHQLLLDMIALPLLWLGLLANFPPLFTEIHAAIIGAIAGYLSLWIIAKVYQRLRGIEALGYGDFKLLATLGAWLGWQALPIIVIIATLLALATTLILMFYKKYSPGQSMPFGPYLATAGVVTLLWGQPLIYLYWRVIY